MKSPITKLAAAVLIIVVVLSIFYSSKAKETKLVPIDIKLPKKVFTGTELNIVVPNLDKPSDKARPPFLAPPGVKNVALGKSVKSSDPFTLIGRSEYITDGNKDSTDGNYVEFGPGVRQVTIDLGELCEIYAVVIWHLHKNLYIFYDVVVQTADDENFVENVHTLFNNDIDNSAGLGIGTDKHYIETNQGRLIDARSTKGRYVRLYSNGNNDNDRNYYIEVEVYGKPVK